jgi:hypothetical protein
MVAGARRVHAAERQLVTWIVEMGSEVHRLPGPDVE